MATYANNWRLSRNFELLHSALQQQQQHKQQQDKLEKNRKKFATAKAANALSRTKLKGNSKGERR